MSECCLANPTRADSAVNDPMGARLMMISSGVTWRSRRLGQTELDVRRSRQKPGTMDGVRPKTHRPGMEPRNRGGDPPPRRAARRWTVEDRRVGLLGGAMVCCAVCGTRIVRAAAAVSRRYSAAYQRDWGRSPRRNGTTFPDARAGFLCKACSTASIRASGPKGFLSSALPPVSSSNLETSA